jgi:glutathione peroxidase
MANATKGSAHAFSFHSLEGKPLPLSEFAGKPLLVVNTASKCGFTPQYKGLDALWQANRARGLVVLGVPCNDFGGQEPGNSEEIATFCERRFGVDFPLTEKVHVKGDEAHPLFRWLVAEGAGRPRWNFYKYLIGPDGQLVDWFSSVTSPSSGRFTKAIERLISTAKP